MNPLVLSLLSVLIISAFSFVGVIFLAVKKKILEKILLFLVSFAAGGLLGDAFLHLLPEAVNAAGGLETKVSLAVLVGILLFFVLEKFVCWRHCHVPTSREHPHPLAVMNLIGDGLHNLTDGLVIGASFFQSPALGLATTLAVIFHEIPQEIGDFGVLIHGGFSRQKALFFNFISALTAFLGVFLIFFFSSKLDHFNFLLIPFTAGGFIYIAGSDLLPELKKETNIRKSALQLAGILLGISVMLLLTKLE